MTEQRQAPVEVAHRMAVPKLDTGNLRMRRQEPEEPASGRVMANGLLITPTGMDLAALAAIRGRCADYRRAGAIGNPQWLEAPEMAPVLAKSASHGAQKTASALAACRLGRDRLFAREHRRSSQFLTSLRFQINHGTP